MEAQFIGFSSSDMYINLDELASACNIFELLMKW